SGPAGRSRPSTLRSIRGWSRLEPRSNGAIRASSWRSTEASRPRTRPGPSRRARASSWSRPGWSRHRTPPPQPGAWRRSPRGRPRIEGRAEVPETILVVDDDPDIARFVEVNLRSAGYDVAVAGDGEEALDKASEIRPDLVLLDVMMPRIDGFEVAQRLRRSPQTANTSIIMLTAKALSADKVTGLQSGADDYIIKPFDPIELLARVKGTLRRAKEMR